MSAADYNREKAIVDQYLAAGFTVNNIHEHLDGCDVTFRKDGKSETVRLTNADARKYLAAHLYYSQDRAIRIDENRLRETIETFADFGRTENNGVNRLCFSEEDLRVRDYFVQCCKQLGMSVKVDDLGNIYATLEGLEDRPPIVIGSHMDTVRKGGRFDGVLGVIAGLEIVRTLVDHRIKPKYPITVVDFTNEEGARFEPAMMCSGIMAGKFDKEKMLLSADEDGTTFGEALATSGYQGDVANRLKEAAAFLEMHIEQGPVLEQEGVSIGIVKGVVGMVCYEIAVHGQSNHAGTTPMPKRKDALRAAMHLISELSGKLDSLDPDLVYTIGRFNVYPNVHTVIPNRVVFTLEARHRNEEVVKRVEQIICENVISTQDSPKSAVKLWERKTVWFDPGLCARLEKSAAALGYSWREMVSGAGHDAQFITEMVPTAMLFVPSVDGKSHCEEEFTPYEECAKGVNVLLHTVLGMLEETVCEAAEQ
jgi:N-carbamoyl-L-amino-acid hydrolase